MTEELKLKDLTVEESPQLMNIVNAISTVRNGAFINVETKTEVPVLKKAQKDNPNLKITKHSKKIYRLGINYSHLENNDTTCEHLFLNRKKDFRYLKITAKYRIKVYNDYTAELYKRVDNKLIKLSDITNIQSNTKLSDLKKFILNIVHSLEDKQIKKDKNNPDDPAMEKEFETKIKTLIFNIVPKTEKELERERNYVYVPNKHHHALYPNILVDNNDPSKMYLRLTNDNIHNGKTIYILDTGEIISFKDILSKGYKNKTKTQLASPILDVKLENIVSINGINIK